MTDNELQVWKVTERDWYAAATFAEAARCALADGSDEDEIFKFDGPNQPLPLTEEELKAMSIGNPDEPDRNPISGWNLLQWLRQTGPKAIFFASTEW